MIDYQYLVSVDHAPTELGLLNTRRGDFLNMGMAEEDIVLYGGIMHSLNTFLPS